MNNQSFRWSAWLRSKVGLVTLAFLAIAGFYLVTEHTAHVLGVLPYAVFLLCPLMHLFMHGGHGEHEGHQPREHEGHQGHGDHHHADGDLPQPRSENWPQARPEEELR